MQFLAAPGALQLAVKAVESCITPKSPQESFSQVLIRAKEGRCFLEACGPSSSAYFEVENAEVTDFSSIAVPGQAFVSVAKACQGEEVGVAANLAKGVVSIVNGDSQWSLPCFPGDSFLRFHCSEQTPDGVVVPASWVKHAMTACKPIMRDDAASSPVAQIGFLDDHAIIGAASRNRGTYHKIKAAGETKELIHWTTLPGANALAQAAAFIGDWRGDAVISADAKACYISIFENRFTFHPASGANMLKAVVKKVPTKPGFRLKLNTGELKSALKRATIGAQAFKAVKLWAGTGVGLMFVEPSVVSNKVKLDVLNREGDGTIMLNYEYLDDCLDACQEDELQLFEEGGICFITSGTTRCVVAGIVTEEAEHAEEATASKS